MKALAPANDPDRIARAVVASARRPRRERLSGLGSRALVHGHWLAPRLTERLVALQAPLNNLDETDPAPPSDGNLHEPARLPATERGGWSARRTLGPVAAGLLRRA